MWDTFQTHWTVEDMSDFCLGRPDWAMLVSIFGCLWQEAFRVWPADALLNWAKTPRRRDEVVGRVENTGIASSPALLVWLFPRALGQSPGGRPQGRANAETLVLEAETDSGGRPVLEIA